MELPNTVTRGKLKKVLIVYKEKISAAYSVSDVEIEELRPLCDRDTKNKAEELEPETACWYEEIIHRFKYRKTANTDFDSWFLVTKVLF